MHTTRLQTTILVRLRPWWWTERVPHQLTRKGRGACIYMEGWGPGDQKVTNMLGCFDLQLRIKTEYPVSEPSSSYQVQYKIPATLPNVVSTPSQPRRLYLGEPQYRRSKNNLLCAKRLLGFLLLNSRRLGGHLRQNPVPTTAALRWPKQTYLAIITMSITSQR